MMEQKQESLYTLEVEDDEAPPYTLEYIEAPEYDLELGAGERADIPSSPGQAFKQGIRSIGADGELAAYLHEMTDDSLDPDFQTPAEADEGQGQAPYRPSAPGDHTLGAHAHAESALGTTALEEPVQGAPPHAESAPGERTRAGQMLEAPLDDDGLFEEEPRASLSLQLETLVSRLQAPETDRSAASPQPYALETLEAPGDVLDAIVSGTGAADGLEVVAFGTGAADGLEVVDGGHPRVAPDLPTPKEPPVSMMAALQRELRSQRALLERLTEQLADHSTQPSPATPGLEREEALREAVAAGLARGRHLGYAEAMGSIRMIRSQLEATYRQVRKGLDRPEDTRGPEDRRRLLETTAAGLHHCLAQLEGALAHAFEQTRDDPPPLQ